MERQRGEKSSYAIKNLSMKFFSKIIKELENFPHEGYVRNSPKREPIDSYFYLAIHIAKCIMRYDAFNLHVETVRTEITGTQQISILSFFF